VKGKIIQLKLREGAGRRENGNAAEKASGLLELPLQEVKRLIWTAAARAPAALRRQLLAIADKGEHICPLLYLLIASSGRGEAGQATRLAASLEALHLALETHRDIAAPGLLPPKEAILCGDFYFGLALTLAGGHPLFIQGMSEVITRFAAARINAPDRPSEAQDLDGYLQELCNGRASIFALSCALGAAHGGYPLWQSEALTYYGLYLGIGLQLKREVEIFRLSLGNKKLAPAAGLPLLYILRKSPLRDRLRSLLNKTLSGDELELFLEEVNRLDPCSYTSRVIGHCFAKANQFIELLRENMDSQTIQALKSFLV
jgi:geranylgeranyl pyrophosphate synthase